MELLTAYFMAAPAVSASLARAFVEAQPNHPLLLPFPEFVDPTVPPSDSATTDKEVGEPLCEVSIPIPVYTVPLVVGYCF